MAVVGEAAEVVVAGREAVVGISEAEAALDRPWEVLRRSIALQHRRLDLRRQPRGLMSVEVVSEQEQEIGPLCNRDHGQVAEQLPVHDLQRNRGHVRVAELELDRDKELAPARGLRIDRLRAQEWEPRIVWASRNSRRGCRGWELARRRERPLAHWRRVKVPACKTAWQIKLRASDKRV